MKGNDEIDRDRFIQRLAELAGGERVRADVDGLPEEVPAVAAAEPASVEQAAELVRAAAADGFAVYPLGGRTSLQLGYAGTRPGLALSTLGLDQLIDFPARDMTITVQAGMSVAALQQAARPERLRLPVDVPEPARATVGGALACNASGPLRYGRGTLRDYLLGVKVVNAAGRVVRGGGRVVKNAAGYDLCKLYCGSFGTLGLMVEATFKLWPVPECSGTAWAAIDDLDGLDESLERLVRSATRPVFIEVLDRHAVRWLAEQRLGAELPAGEWTLLVGYEGTERGLAWQRDRVRDELADPDCHCRTVEWLEGQQTDRLVAALSEFRTAQLGELLLKANVLGSRLCEFLAELARGPVPWAMQSHAGNGIVYAQTLAPLARAEAAEHLAELRQKATRLKGNLVIYRCPAGWKRHLPLWGQRRDDWSIMKAIKESLDPHWVFNPGRFIDGALSRKQPERPAGG